MIRRGPGPDPRPEPSLPRCTSGRKIEGLPPLGEQVDEPCGRILSLLRGAQVCHHCDWLGRDPYAPIPEVQDER